jgi:hypothetical protein
MTVIYIAICVLEESVFWFVCTASYGLHVFATRPTQIQNGNRLNFMESFQFIGLPEGFVITLEVYSLRMRKVTLPYEERYHMGRKVCADQQVSYRFIRYNMQIV